MRTWALACWHRQANNQLESMIRFAYLKSIPSAKVLKMEWRGHTTFQWEKFPVAARSFFWKRENGWFDDLQVKLLLCIMENHLNSFWSMENEEKKWIVVFQHSQPFISSMLFFFSAAKCRWIYIKVYSYTVLVTYWLNLFFNLTYFPHMKYFGSDNREVVIQHLFCCLN